MKLYKVCILNQKKLLGRKHWYDNQLNKIGNKLLYYRKMDIYKIAKNPTAVKYDETYWKTTVDPFSKFTYLKSEEI